MKRMQTSVLILVSSALCVNFLGCNNKFFDPTQIGRWRPTPAVNVILDSLGVAEETPVAWEDAEEPRPSDIVALETDYVFQPGDLVRITIFELFLEGTTLISDFTVTETGKISIPDVGVIQAAGLTEAQLEEEIRQILSPSILKEPSVSAILLSSQQRTYSILGDGVPGPGRYMIPRYDFRLTDALATARGPRQFNVSYIYVSRKTKGQQQAREVAAYEAAGPRGAGLEVIDPRLAQQRMRGPGIAERRGRGQEPELEREMLDMIAPMAQHRWPESKKVVASAERAEDKRFQEVVVPGSFELLGGRSRASSEGGSASAPGNRASLLDVAGGPDVSGPADKRVEWIFKDGKWIPVPVDVPRSTQPTVTREPDSSQADVEWVFQGGKWVPVSPGQPTATAPVIRPGRTSPGVQWVFKDGRWTPVQVGPPVAAKPPVRFEGAEGVIPLDEKLPEELEWEEAVQSRLIRIPVSQLLAGDPRYNIVVKPGDTIHVPVDIVGEFCITGNVNRSGYVNVTGRPMTLKMAIAAAGGLGPLAWPKRCEVVRRIGERREEIVMVDLDKIARGEQPDFFIKPNDLINVGTHSTSRWRAILRNAFRATYGFGFVYDRNFAIADYGAYNPITPWKWDRLF
ncbi:MAG: polysaccharide biosynthesis/export family protein [Phycisphaerales bacterium]|nr:MAG: polysaccharide biosynthesis/export family protein [Phycisphaerales bacterium]